MELIHF